MKQKGILIFGLLLSTFISQAQSSYLDSTFTSYFRRTHGWTGGDATLSIALPDGKTMWLFGDSYIDHYDSTNNTLPCLFQVRNCVTVQDAISLNQMTTHIDSTKTGINQTYFKIGTVGSTVYWPDHGFVKDDTVFVFLGKFNGTTLEFQGQNIAKVLLPSFKLLSITPLPSMNSLVMGKAVIYDAPSGYYYIYGNKLNWIIYEPYIARTKFEDLVSGNWEFYTGNGWSTNPSSAKKICDDPVSPSFSVIKLKSRYYLITQENGYLTCGLGRNIYSYSSGSPSGKFQIQHLLYTVEDQINGHYLLTYNAFSHPEFTANDELLISYNVNDMVDTLEPDVCPSQCKHPFSDRFNADSYRPKFVRVPYIVLGIKSGKGLHGVEVQPNPAMNILRAQLASDFSQRGTITFINKMGQVMLQKRNIELNAGTNEVQIDISSLPSDVYLMMVQPEDMSNSESWEPRMILKN
jgi:hypothetical protein